MKPSFLFRLPALTLAVSACFALAACGGGSSSSPETSSATADEPAMTLPASGTQQADADPAPALPGEAPQAGAVPVTDTMPDPVLPMLAMPSGVASGSVLELQCGRTYQGSLDLAGKSDITVRTAGDCGNAVISPGQAITGWSRHQGNVFSAPAPFAVAQVIVGGEPMRLAHWPSRAQTWAKASASNASSLSYAMPNPDLAGATLVFKPYEWAVEARRINGYSGTTMAVGPTGNINFDGYALGGQVEFYVEGKLWMLDEPGEWAVSGGRLYVWAPDGQSPEGRIWVAPDQDGIRAANSRNITVQDISIYGAANGINALDAKDLKAERVRISHSSGNGILNSGGSGLTVDGSAIRFSRHDAIAVKWGGGGETVRNSTIEASGNFGMPTNAHAAINLTAGNGAVVQNNRVTDSGYIGIRVFRDAVASGNTVDGACLVLTDCGGIFTSARDKLPLNTRIENNVIGNVGKAQRLAWALYLGDFANGVTVAGNAVTGSGNGMEILNGFDNTVTGNTFASSTQAHIQIVESGSTASVRNNVFSGNRFTTSGRQEMYRLSSDLGTGAVSRFGSYAANTYVSSSSIFANFNGEALSFAQWRERTGQDAGSTFSAP
ncbi:MAG: right-handed parallel beta-helix repeat-containing protein [Noviherbaspirillum sp.]